MFSRDLFNALPAQSFRETITFESLLSVCDQCWSFYSQKEKVIDQLRRLADRSEKKDKCVCVCMRLVGWAGKRNDFVIQSLYYFQQFWRFVERRQEVAQGFYLHTIKAPRSTVSLRYFSVSLCLGKEAHIHKCSLM